MEAAVEFMWWGGGVGSGLHSHFHVQPNYSVDVVLGSHWGCDNVQFSVVQSNTKKLLCPYITLCVLRVSLDKIQASDCLRKGHSCGFSNSQSMLSFSENPFSQVLCN